ncbi:peptide arginase family protein [Tepidibacter formicigenes]|jgi:hypothetical protein|uniref:UPF0489 domain-containing protein n=1 Tax=Tepidibacter formicigenes DSM 15518 TaxID=1123349 RepID=A0A1M6QWY7_9FIRM|nr:UPF0489 family protein [Tepidibacter formicigenes]SHK24715.1 UPF0489 domain-containing protein [Tepidibacter formicigenes DSM 15518]
MNYYKGFFINEPVGNNIFSYDERKQKKIYVPPLKEGNIEDAKIGENIVFCEIEDKNEINALGLEYFIKYLFNEKDVYIFDNHNHAFYFWVESLKRGKFKKGIKLVHVDQHKDMREPNTYIKDINDLENVFKYTNFNLNVGNFIKPALKLGIFSDVVILDNLNSFYLDINEEFVLDIDLDIFSKDMDYIDYDLKISKIKELIKKSKVITIATSPFFIEQNYAIDVLKEIFKF